MLLAAQSRVTAQTRAGAHVQRRSSRCLAVRVQAFTTTDNGKQSVEEMNRLIGMRIKEAASHMGTMRVWHANAAIGKYVKQAAADAATGKLKVKGIYTKPASTKK